MAILSNQEINVIRENTKCNVTDNDIWGNDTVVMLIDTIEAQQQEIEQIRLVAKKLTEYATCPSEDDGWYNPEWCEEHCKPTMSSEDTLECWIEQLKREANQKEGE